MQLGEPQSRRQLWAACSLRLVGIHGASFLSAPCLEPPLLPCGVWVAKGGGLLAWAVEPQPKLALNCGCFPC